MKDFINNNLQIDITQNVINSIMSKEYEKQMLLKFDYSNNNEANYEKLIL